MTTTKILASTVITLASLAAGSAFAETISYPSFVDVPSQSTVSRAEVRAELVQAENTNHLLSTNTYKDYPSVMDTSSQSTVSRAQVRAELAQAEKGDHLLSTNTYKDYPMTMQANSPASRADVHAALSQTR